MGGGPLLMIGGWIDDELVRKPAGWRIRHRRGRAVWFDGNPAVLGLDVGRGARRPPPRATLVSLRDAIGLDHIMMECDYPHTDARFPFVQDTVLNSTDGCTEDEIHQLAWANASRLYRHPLPDVAGFPAVPEHLKPALQLAGGAPGQVGAWRRKVSTRVPKAVAGSS